jgi:uncharacterized protein
MILSLKLVNQIRSVLSKYAAVEQCILFGSRARGDAGERSDIDLAILAPPISESDWVTLYYQLKEELDTLLRVDVVRMERVSAELQNSILKEGKELYRHEPDQS